MPASAKASQSGELTPKSAKVLSLKSIEASPTTSASTCSVGSSWAKEVSAIPLVGWLDFSAINRLPFTGKTSPTVGGSRSQKILA